VKKKKRFPNAKGQFATTRQDKGAGLIIVILVMAFLLTIGLVLLTVTGTGPQVAGNIRLQQQAFNAAEAGFDSSWTAIEDSFENEAWSNFDGHYLKEPPGIDLPTSGYYFRKLTNQELLDLLDSDGDGTPDVANVIFFEQPYISRGGSLDSRFTYTTFLIDDEAVGVTPDPNDVLLVCIGVVSWGGRLTTSRLEIVLAIQLPGTT